MMIHLQEKPPAGPRLVFVSRVDAGEFSAVPRAAHAHADLCEMLFISGGGGSIRIGGREYDVKSGDAAVYNAGVLHDEQADRNSGMSHFGLAVAGLAVKGLAPNCLIPEGARPVVGCGPFAEYMSTAFETMWRLLSDRQMPAGEACGGIAASLLTLVRERAASSPGEAGCLAGDDSLFLRVRGYIDDHFTEQLTLESISSALRVSRYYMSRVFRARCGFSPKQYVNWMRMGRAQVLLTDSGRSVTDIAYEVGFNNLSNFDLAFTGRFGLSPSDFRRRYGKTSCAGGDCEINTKEKRK